MNETIDTKSQKMHGGRRTGSGRKKAGWFEILRAKTWFRAALLEAGWDGKTTLSDCKKALLINTYIDDLYDYADSCEVNSAQVGRIKKGVAPRKLRGKIASYEWNVGIGDSGTSLWKAIKGEINDEIGRDLLMPGAKKKCSDAVYRLCTAINEYVINNAITISYDDENNPITMQSISSGRDADLEQKLHDAIYAAKDELLEAGISKHELLNAIREQCNMTTDSIDKPLATVDEIADFLSEDFGIEINIDAIKSGDEYAPIYV